MGPCGTSKRVCSGTLFLVIGWLSIFLSLFIVGWGWWGNSVTGDYALDLTDSMRRSYGEIPYRDFIPTYGALHIHLFAPFFFLGKQTFAAVWGITGFAILIETLLLVSLFRKQKGKFSLWVIGAVFLVHCAFNPSNANYMMGYSPSGFLSSFLWIVAIRLVCSLGSRIELVTRRIALISFGVVLGLQIFTKMDPGMMACGILVVFVVSGLFTKQHYWKYVLTGFLGIVFLVWGLLVFQGGRIDILWQSFRGAFSLSSVLIDDSLRFRVILLAIGIFLSRCLLSTSFKKHLPCSRSLWAAVLILGLPVAIFGDLARENFNGPAKGGVFLKYYECALVLNGIAGFIILVLKTRSPRLFWKTVFSWKVLTLMVAGGALVRVGTSGWYPFNYYQPAPLIITILALQWSFKRIGSVKLSCATFFRSAIFGAFALSMIILGWHSYTYVVRDETAVELVTPWGKCWIPPVYHALPIYSKMAAGSKDEGLFASRSPGIYLITGLKPASYLTLMENLAWAGPYSHDWEEQGIAIFHSRKPRFVYIPTYPVLATFGEQYCVLLSKELPVDYSLVVEDRLRGQLWERKASIQK